MTKIELKLFVTLDKYFPKKNKGEKNLIEVKDNMSVDEFIKELRIPEDMVKLIFVNGKKKPFDYKLKNNDRLGLFPPVGGG